MKIVASDQVAFYVNCNIAYKMGLIASLMNGLLSCLYVHVCFMEGCVIK